jgi:hypothetical protein
MEGKVMEEGALSLGGIKMPLFIGIPVFAHLYL